MNLYCIFKTHITNELGKFHFNNEYILCLCCNAFDNNILYYKCIYYDIYILTLYITLDHFQKTFSPGDRRSSGSGPE